MSGVVVLVVERRAAQCAAPTESHPPRFAWHLPLKGKAFRRPQGSPLRRHPNVPGGRVWDPPLRRIQNGCIFLVGAGPRPAHPGFAPGALARQTQAQFWNRRLRPPPSAFLVTFWASQKSLAAGAAKSPCNYESSRFRMARAACTPEAPAWARPRVTPAPSPAAKKLGMAVSSSSLSFSRAE